MRKEVVIVSITCDWCKNECKESEIIFEQYDLCLDCKKDMISLLEAKDTALRPIPSFETEGVLQKTLDVLKDEPKKRGRKKKEEPVEVTTIAKDLGLDMRVSSDANRLEKAIAVAGEEATKEEVIAAIETGPEYFSDIPDHKTLLKEYLEEKGFDFTTESDRARAMNLKLALISCRVELKNLKAWLDENVECSEIDLPF